MIKEVFNQKIWIILLACLVGLLILNWQVVTQFLPGNTDNEIVKGEIMVVFNQGTKEAEAMSVLNKYELVASERFFRYDYITFYAKDNNLENGLALLKKEQIVTRAEIIVPADKSIKPWIVADFSRLVSIDEINSIIAPDKNLYVDENFFSVDIQKIKVPVGKEKYFAEKLQQEPTVKYAEVNTVVKIQ